MDGVGQSGVRCFFPSGWDMMDCVGGWSGIKWCQVFFPIRVGIDGLCRWMEWDKVVLLPHLHEFEFLVASAIASNVT